MQVTSTKKQNRSTKGVQQKKRFNDDEDLKEVGDEVGSREAEEAEAETEETAAEERQQRKLQNERV